MTGRELIYNTLLNGIPYGVMGSVMQMSSVTHHGEETNEPVEIDGQIKGLRNNGYVEFYYPDGSFNLFRINDVKPYLRPLSSMTEEERKEYKSFIFTQHHEWDGHGTSTNYVEINDAERYVTWLNKHHFDHRGLIEKGLALPAKDGMYSPPIWALVPTGGR